MIKTLTEALPISVAKKYMKISNGKYKKLYPALFKNGEDRISFPFEVELKGEDSPLYDQCREILTKNNYVIKDYIAGYATDEAGKQTFKIGKLITQFIEAQKNPDPTKHINYSWYYSPASNMEEFYAMFQKDPIRLSQGKNFAIIISRHPYDIAGMSTDRTWESCQAIAQEKSIVYGKNIRPGQYHDRPTKGLKSAVKEGALVAYWVEAEPRFRKINTGTAEAPNMVPLKDALQYPIARLTIAPFKAWDNSVYLRAETTTYPHGFKSKEFSTAVQAFLDKKYNKKQTDIKTKQYNRNTKVYADNRYFSSIGENQYHERESFEIDKETELAIYRTTEEYKTGLVKLHWSKPHRKFAPFTGKKEDIVIPFGKYQSLDRLSKLGDSIVVYTMNGKYKYGAIQVYPKVKVIAPTIYDSEPSFEFNKALNKLTIKTNVTVGQWSVHGLKDIDGNDLIPARYDVIRMLDDSHSEIYEVRAISGLWGAYNVLERKMIINCKYKQLELEKNIIVGLYHTEDELKEYKVFFDLNGKMIANPRRKVSPKITKRK